MPVKLRMTVNGEVVALESPATRRLLDILRDDLDLVGAKPGCRIGRCGACVVLVDDRPVNACLTMGWQLEGATITTVEGLADDPAAALVRDALARCGAVQCGYCSAGLVTTLAHLVAHEPRPDRDEALAATAGHLCRCTGYQGLRRAVDVLFGAPAAGP